MKSLFKQRVLKNIEKAFLFGLAIVLIQSLVCAPASAQTKKEKATAERSANPNAPKVTQIDSIAFKTLLKRANGDGSKPLLVNFWATWCDPCREEFPDLVKIDTEYKDKIDFITVSLDDLAEINRDVPKFLESVKASMPAYLLKTDDEEAVIASVYKDWRGGLPFTILFDRKGEIAYSRQGKIKLDVMRAEIDKISGIKNSTPLADMQIVNLPLAAGNLYSYEKGVEEARRDIIGGRLVIKRYGLTPAISPVWLQRVKKKYGVEFVEHGCVVLNGFADYARGYNETAGAEIRRKFGAEATEILGKL